MREAGIAWIVAAVISILAWVGWFCLALMLFGKPAHAERYCAHWYGVRVYDGWSYRVERRCARWVHRDRDEEYYRRYDPRPERVYGYEYRDDDDRYCKETHRATGDQHLTEDGAKKAANDAWAGTIRFHLGELYMDLSNARHIVYTCSRSSIKEAGASVTTGFAAFTRCEISAKPCRAPARPEAREPQ